MRHIEKNAQLKSCILFRLKDYVSICSYDGVLGSVEKYLSLFCPIPKMMFSAYSPPLNCWNMKPPMYVFDTFPWANQNILLEMMVYCLCDFLEHLNKSFKIFVAPG